MTARASSCPTCGATLAEGSPFGLCSGCLVAAALDEGEPADEVADVVEAKPGLPYATVGHYRLLEKLGEGAFGEVFAAEQAQPVERKVAIKILKRGMDSAQIVARFEAERQALALMNHPNVATVLDGGETEDGRPFFVMEFVDGEPVTDFCERRSLGLSLNDRLRLFLTICEGVQHAHGRGIIHRDLKPQNVLVEEDDKGRAVAKVIDFGIAKATDCLLTTRTLHTELGRLVGTPAYMSPEQAESAGADVDVRTDVYSLGILLYEIVTGDTPFDAERLRRAGPADLERILKDEQPPRPSSRVSERAVEDGGHVGITAAELRGDLDWIVMRALEKERARRYASAADFGRDLERYLAGDAVQARPPSKWYRLSKWARRNRVALFASAAVFVALAAGTIISTTQMLRAMRAEEAAEERAEIADALNDFFEDDLIAAALERGALDFNSLIKVLTHAEKKIEGRLTKYPVAEASARLMLARTLLGAAMMADSRNPLVRAGIYANAQRNARRALDLFEGELESLSDRRYTGSAQTLARALLELGQAEQALGVTHRVFAKLGKEVDLGEKYQRELALSELEAAARLGDRGAALACHRRLLAEGYGDVDIWEAVDRSYRTLAQLALDRGQIDEAADRVRHASILARMTTHSGTWDYMAAYTAPLRQAIERGGARPEQTATPWAQRLTEWDLEAMAESFALAEPARSMVLAFLQSESGDPASAAATLAAATPTGAHHRLLKAQAIYLDQAGGSAGACRLAQRASTLAQEEGDLLALYQYAAEWARLRKATGAPLDPVAVPISAEVTGPGGHRYARIEIPLPWHDGAQLCRALGGHLATVGSDAENAFLYKNFATDRMCWLGASDHEVEDEWRWVTGEPWESEHWAQSQPSGNRENPPVANEDYAMFGNFDFREHGVREYWQTGDRWIDQPDDGLVKGGNRARTLLVSFAICEWDN